MTQRRSVQYEHPDEYQQRRLSPEPKSVSLRSNKKPYRPPSCRGPKTVGQKSSLYNLTEDRVDQKPCDPSQRTIPVEQSSRKNSFGSKSHQSDGSKSRNTSESNGSQSRRNSDRSVYCAAPPSVDLVVGKSSALKPHKLEKPTPKHAQKYDEPRSPKFEICKPGPAVQVKQLDEPKSPKLEIPKPGPAVQVKQLDEPKSPKFEIPKPGPAVQVKQLDEPKSPKLEIPKPTAAVQAKHLDEPKSPKFEIPKSIPAVHAKQFDEPKSPKLEIPKPTPMVNVQLNDQTANAKCPNVAIVFDKQEKSRPITVLETQNYDLTQLQHTTKIPVNVKDTPPKLIKTPAADGTMLSHPLYESLHPQPLPKKLTSFKGAIPTQYEPVKSMKKPKVPSKIKKKPKKGDYVFQMSSGGSSMGPTENDDYATLALASDELFDMPMEELLYIKVTPKHIDESKSSGSKSESGGSKSTGEVFDKISGYTGPHRRNSKLKVT